MSSIKALAALLCCLVVSAAAPAYSLNITTNVPSSITLNGTEVEYDIVSGRLDIAWTVFPLTIEVVPLDTKYKRQSRALQADQGNAVVFVFENEKPRKATIRIRYDAATPPARIECYDKENKESFAADDFTASAEISGIRSNGEKIEITNIFSYWRTRESNNWGKIGKRDSRYVAMWDQRGLSVDLLDANTVAIIADAGKYILYYNLSCSKKGIFSWNHAHYWNKKELDIGPGEQREFVVEYSPPLDVSWRDIR